MTRRIVPTALLLLFAFATPTDAAERYTTENFVVEAPSKELAKTFGEYAERYRVEKAMDWLGYEMPRWPQRCPLKVRVTLSETGGATTFTFGQGGDGRSQVLSRKMEIFGETKKLLNSVLPHEVTHTVLAHHFGQPVPRWADEGGSVLSENEDERYEHDVRCREILNQGRGIKLGTLFSMKQYPKDMIVVYAQGYSMSQYLIEQGGRKKFLEFVGTGMKNDNRNWEQAVKMYGYDSTDELQEAWIESLRTPPSRVAARNAGKSDTRSAADPRPSATLSSRGGETRSSALPGLPLLEPPIVARGAAPAAEKSASTSVQARPTPPSVLPKLLPPEPPTKK
jgi:hypothetical protein